MKPAKNCFLIISFLSLLVCVISCTGTRKSSNSLIEWGELMFVDQSDNGYVLRGQRSLIKYNFRNHPTDRHDFDLSVRQAGLSTDLRIYAYNPDFQNFYILDKYLNEISHFSFTEYFDFLVSHAVLANGQNIWLYNQSENKIQKYTSQLEFLDESRNLNWEISGVTVDQLLFHRNEIYLVDHRKGVFIFDFAGRMRQQIPLPMMMRDIQIDRSMSRIYAFFSYQWHVIDPDQKIPAYEPLNITGQAQFTINDNIIFENGKIYHWNIDLQKIEVIENDHILLRNY